MKLAHQFRPIFIRFYSVLTSRGICASHSQRCRTIGAIAPHNFHICQLMGILSPQPGVVRKTVKHHQSLARYAILPMAECLPRDLSNSLTEGQQQPRISKKPPWFLRNSEDLQDFPRTRPFLKTIVVACYCLSFALPCPASPSQPRIRQPRHRALPSVRHRSVCHAGVSQLPEQYMPFVFFPSNQCVVMAEFARHGLWNLKTLSQLPKPWYAHPIAWYSQCVIKFCFDLFKFSCLLKCHESPLEQGIYIIAPIFRTWCHEGGWIVDSDRIRSAGCVCQGN